MSLAALTLQAATERAWRIGHLFDEKAMDRNAALFSLSLLYQQSDNARVRHLCVTTAERIGGRAAQRPHRGC